MNIQTEWFATFSDVRVQCAHFLVILREKRVTKIRNFTGLSAKKLSKVDEENNHYCSELQCYTIPT